MAGFMGGSSTSKWEPLSLIVGVISLISAVFFFLYRFKIIDVAIELSDEFFLYFFPSLIVVSGVVHLLSTVGVLGMR